MPGFHGREANLGLNTARLFLSLNPFLFPSPNYFDDFGSMQMYTAALHLGLQSVQQTFARHADPQEGSTVSSRLQGKPRHRRVEVIQCNREISVSQPRVPLAYIARPPEA